MSISKTFTSSFADLMDKRMMDIWTKQHSDGPPEAVSCYHCASETFSVMLVNTCPHCCGKGVAAVPVSDVL